MPPEYPLASDSLLVARTTFGPVAHEWTGNDDHSGHHHGLYWESKRAGRTVHVGTYKLNLRRLIQAGYAREETKRKARLRFVRTSNGAIVIQINDSAPSLPVGQIEPSAFPSAKQ